MASPLRMTSAFPTKRRLVTWSIVVIALLVAAPALRRENLFSEGGALESTKPLPEFPSTGVEWIGTEPLTLETMRGRVWVLKFWTFGCVNCVRSIPYANELTQRFDDEVRVLGIHSPEFEWERDPQALDDALRKRDVRFPSMIDSGLEYFLELESPAWPSYYVIDRDLKIRGRWVGEMHEGTMRARALEALIEQLLAS